MRIRTWQLALSVSLLVLSVLLYVIHYVIFHDSYHIVYYFLLDIAFVPIEVLLVTLIVHELLSARERRSMFEKLNMVIGAFFSEVGTKLLALSFACDTDAEHIRTELEAIGGWTGSDYATMRRRLNNYPFNIDKDKIDLRSLQGFLIARRDFLLRLLENPNLLEHEKFTELLWAVFHLTDELAFRTDVDSLPDSDRAHLAGDMRRAYVLIAQEWLTYMGYLKREYPYLYSLSMRTNPFNPKASPVVM